MQNDGRQLLDQLEHFVNSVVQSAPRERSEDQLAERLDVLERIVELLRIRTGRLENRVRMQTLIQSGIALSSQEDGGFAVQVGGSDAIAGTRGWCAANERHQTDLQRPLLLYLLHFHDTGGRIESLLRSFVAAIRHDLHPLDFETTGTGVTRVVTTTRSAARVLRLYGLLTDSDRTAYRTWELSVLGLLVATRLREERATLELQERNLAHSYAGRFSGSEAPSEDVMRIVREFRRVDRVAGTLQRLCEPNQDVFTSFDVVVNIVASYCESLDNQFEERSRDRLPLDEAKQKREANEMLSLISDAVPPGLLTEDVRKSLALEELLESARPTNEP